MPGRRRARAAHAETRDRRTRHGGQALKQVLALILGGGQGKRLYPLTQQRSKPAVPLAGKYRLIDIPISNCLHADIRRIFVLTQFNSASLNRHIAQTYRMDLFSPGFVEILAAEQTPDNPDWYQGTADAVRQAARHFEDYEASCYLILAGDHLYRMDYEALVRAHLEREADVTVAAHPVSADEAGQMGILGCDAGGRIVAFDEKPARERLRQIGREPFTASMGIYVFSRRVLFDLLHQDAHDFGREVIPAALQRYRVHAFLHHEYWADVGTVASFYEANIALTRPDAPFNFYDARCPIYTQPRFLPGARLADCTVRDSIIAEGCNLERCTVDQSVVGIRTRVGSGSSIRRSVLLGADYYDAKLGIGRDVVLDGVIVDKNVRIGDGARLVNRAALREADGEGYCIRDGIIVVPKGAVVPAGLQL